jgi:hypothetical protein
MREARHNEYRMYGFISRKCVQEQAKITLLREVRPVVDWGRMWEGAMLSEQVILYCQPEQWQRNPPGTEFNQECAL